MRPRARLTLLMITVLAGSLAVAAGPAAAGGPITWTWPTGSCSGTIQQCVTGASSGDTIQIATNGTVDERPTWQDKSLKIEAAPGFAPVIKNGLLYTALTGTRTLTISGIRFNGEVDIVLQGGSGHVVTLDHVTIRPSTGVLSSSALYIPTQVPASVTVRHATISNRSPQGGGILFDGSNDSGSATFTLVASRISARGNPSSGSGLALYARGAGGTVDIDVANTVVHDVARCGCGGAVGIHLLGGSTAQARFRLAGLTMDRSGDAGLSVDDRMDAGGSMDVRVFNSIVSRSASAGIFIGSQQGSTLAFRAGFNAYSGNGPNRLAGRSLGPRNVKVAPRYVDPSGGDLRLRRDSPLIDRGQVCSPAGVVNPDADGRHRLAGSSVDIGAYERNGPLVTGDVLLSGEAPSLIIATGGRDIVCGYGGPDELDGGGGPDYVDGGAGDDFVAGGTGADRIHGGTGTDTLCAVDGAGSDRLDGGPGTDDFGADAGDIRTAVEVKVACPS